MNLWSRYTALKKYFLVANILLLSAGLRLKAAEWTVLVFVQANNSLSSFATKNFQDMAMVGSNNNLNVLVEWHQPNKPGAWRYKIEHSKMVLDEHSAVTTDGSRSSDLVSAMKWAVSKYPAKKYCLILWNHGIGILDPTWGNSMNIINQAALKNASRTHPKINIPGITTPQTKATKTLPTRGILFNETLKTYMSNQELTRALGEIKRTVMKNQKIDLLGMDACLMAMTEVAYQIKDYANYMVGSQEVELAYGWHYAPLLQMLSSGASPAQAAQSIVNNYENYYKNKIHFYTQSAVDLEKISGLKNSINAFADKILTHKRSVTGYDGVISAIKKARSRCLQFSAPSYIDLHSFLQECLRQLDLVFKNNSNENIDQIKKIIHANIQTIESSVVANTAGKYLAKAKGLSIYYPSKNIDPSYPKTSFAQESSWLSLLKILCSE